MSTQGESSSGGLTVVEAGSLADLGAAGVDVEGIRYVDETEWALATPKPPLATTGAGPCLVVVVHHRGSGRGGLAHVSTTNTRSQKELFESARATVVGLLKRCVAGTSYDSMRDPPLDLFLGAGKELFPGDVTSTAREALPKSHKDLPGWIEDQLGFDFLVSILDRRQRSGGPPPSPTGPLHDTGYVVYDAALARVFVLDRRNGDMVIDLQKKTRASADAEGKGKTWGKHP
jgi:hypothetical protein